MSDLPSSGRQLRTEVTSAGELKLNLVDVDIAPPKPEQVIVRVEASPINPSDLGLLLGMADVTTAKQVGSDDIQPSAPRCRKDFAQFESALG